MPKEYTLEEKRAYAEKRAKETAELVAKAAKKGIRIVAQVKSTKGESSCIGGLRKAILKNGVEEGVN